LPGLPPYTADARSGGPRSTASYHRDGSPSSMPAVSYRTPRIGTSYVLGSGGTAFWPAQSSRALPPYAPDPLFPPPAGRGARQVDPVARRSRCLIEQLDQAISMTYV